MEYSFHVILTQLHNFYEICVVISIRENRVNIFGKSLFRVRSLANNFESNVYSTLMSVWQSYSNNDLSIQQCIIVVGKRYTLLLYLI